MYLVGMPAALARFAQCSVPCDMWGGSSLCWYFAQSPANATQKSAPADTISALRRCPAPASYVPLGRQSAGWGSTSQSTIRANAAASRSAPSGQSPWISVTHSRAGTWASSGSCAVSHWTALTRESATSSRSVQPREPVPRMRLRSVIAAPSEPSEQSEAGRDDALDGDCQVAVRRDPSPGGLGQRGTLRFGQGHVYLGLVLSHRRTPPATSAA